MYPLCRLRVNTSCACCAEDVLVCHIHCLNYRWTCLHLVPVSCADYLQQRGKQTNKKVQERSVLSSRVVDHVVETSRSGHWPTFLRFTCVLPLYGLLVSYLYTVYMCPTFIRFPCVLPLYGLPVSYLYTVYLCPTFIRCTWDHPVTLLHPDQERYNSVHSPWKLRNPLRRPAKEKKAPVTELELQVLRYIISYQDISFLLFLRLTRFIFTLDNLGAE